MKRTEKPSSHLGVKIWDFNLPWGLQDRKSIFLPIQVLFRLMCKEMYNNIIKPNALILGITTDYPLL